MWRPERYCHYGIIGGKLCGRRAQVVKGVDRYRAFLMSNRNGARRRSRESPQSDENARLRRAYDMLPKTAHADPAREQHEVRREWVAQIIENPYDTWEEIDSEGRPSIVLAGRVEGVSQWIKVVISLDGRLVTAFPDRRLTKRFGERPWPPSR